jgi:hypothetical protein
MMMTPSSVQQFVTLGLVTPESLSRCCHREFRGDVWRCPHPEAVICGGCGNGRCLEPYHVYSRFCTVRDSTMFEATGSKFFYRCESCCDFLCVYCLGIADDYPCPPSELESYPFRCPRCGGAAEVHRVDGVDYKGVVEVLASCPSRMLRFSGGG